MDMKLLKKLREETGAGMLDCKQALEESGGDYEKAIEILQKKAKATAQKKASRETSQGLIEAYIHFDGKLGVLAEVNCESDFVANTEEFKSFVKNICMHIAAMNPIYVKAEDIPEDVVAKQKEIFTAQLNEDPKMAKKPDKVKEKIVDGKMNKWLEEVCLLNQKYILDDKKSVKEYLEEVIGKIKENIKIRRFVRFQLGEEIK